NPVWKHSPRRAHAIDAVRTSPAAVHCRTAADRCTIAASRSPAVTASAASRNRFAGPSMTATAPAYAWPRRAARAEFAPCSVGDQRRVVLDDGSAQRTAAHERGDDDAHRRDHGGEAEGVVDGEPEGLDRLRANRLAELFD